MPLASMTGFARSEGSGYGLRWVWEIKSVNGKGLDVRTRLASGFEALEVDIKPLLAQMVTRGTITVSLSVKEETSSLSVSLNTTLLDYYRQTAQHLHKQYGLSMPSAGELLNLRGVIEQGSELAEDVLAKRVHALLPSLDQAIAKLLKIRQEEGNRLEAILQKMLQEITHKVEAAQALADGQAQLLHEKLTSRLADLLGPEATINGASINPDRLAQEVALLALKSDVREEIERLQAHLQAAQDLLTQKSPSGRAFDFLAQEFNREANTLCAKANSIELTRVGLELKSLIDQLREQVQNIE
jgi:uncharacterized protein (TIGR00255 family)